MALNKTMEEQCCFESLLNDSQMCGGRLFQRREAPTENARSPIVDNLAVGTT